MSEGVFRVCIYRLCKLCQREFSELSVHLFIYDLVIPIKKKTLANLLTIIKDFFS